MGEKTGGKNLRRYYETQRMCIWLFLILLVGCQSTETILPTLARLPTATASPMRIQVTVPIPMTLATQAIALEPTPTATASATSTLSATSPFTATVTPSATITQTPSITPTLPPVSIEYDSVFSPSLELRRALNDLIERDRHLLPESNYTVSAVRTADNWAKITLVPTEFVASAWHDVHLLRFIEVYAFRTNRQTWQAFINPETTSQTIPTEFVNHTMPLLADSYRFPWRDGDVWWATQGWHEGFALDFQPTSGASSAVLAAQSGILREVCYDGFQSLLQIQHADGKQTYYMHVRVAGSVRRNLLDQAVQQGQLLGYLYDSIRGQTACGLAWSPHLHFIASDPNLVLDGIPLNEIAAVASCCSASPTFVSSNVMLIVNE